MFELAPFDLPAGYGASILSNDEAKLQCHVLVSITDFDDLIAAFRDASVDAVERYCNLRLAECAGLKWKAESLPARIKLGTGPVTAITAMTYLDSTGTEQSVDVSTLRVAAGGEVVLKPGQSWPSGIHSGITITFTAGFTDANRPGSLVQAVRMFTAHLFKNREAVLTGTISAEIPLGFRALCNGYRIPVI